MIRRLFFSLILIVIAVLWYFADQLTPAETVRAAQADVRDGDTLILGARTFRLYGMDAPEYRQTCTDAAAREWPCGKAARLQLAALAASGSIACEVKAKDKYLREVARCSSATVPDLSEAMVSAGLALSPAERGTAPYADAEAEARRAGRGLWQGRFESPAEWRARKVSAAG